jgi:hypothetical protein
LQVSSGAAILMEQSLVIKFTGRILIYQHWLIADGITFFNTHLTDAGCCKADFQARINDVGKIWQHLLKEEVKLTL